MTLENRRKKYLSKKLNISCVVPIFNEEKNISAFVHQLQEHLKQHTEIFEIILIDDGSKDNTSNIIQQKLLSDQIKWLQFSRNFGKEVALTAGLNHAKGDVVILMDADFQHPITTIDSFLTEWTNGYDMVYAVRSNRKDEGFLKRNITHIFYKLMSLSSKVKIPIDAGDFRLLDKNVVIALNQFKEYRRFMKGLYASVGFKSIGIPFEVAKRTQGKSSFNFYKLCELAITGITSFSNVPLRIWGIIGAVVSSISFVYALWIVFSTLHYGINVPGYPTIIVCILFFGGIQLLSIGILGEYIGRIFEEVKHRPLYIIANSHGFAQKKSKD